MGALHWGAGFKDLKRCDDVSKGERDWEEK